MPDKREDLGQLFGRISRLPEPKSLRDLSTTLNITDFFLVSVATVGLGCDCCATLTVDRCCEQWQMTTVLNMNIDTGSHNCKMVMLSRFAVLCVSLTWISVTIADYIHGPTINRQPLETNELWRVM